MRRIADLYPGEAKTDAKDAAVIADAARTMPHILRSLELTDEITAELTVLTGFDQDLAAEATRTSNRIRGLLTQFHPSLERVLGPRLDHTAVTWLLDRYGFPAALRKASHRRLAEVIRPKAPRMAVRLIGDVFTALDEQTVVAPGTGTLDVVIPSLARSLAAVHDQRRALEAQINSLLEAHPLHQVLTSMPGVGVRTAAFLLVTVGDGTGFPSAAHLAAYAGLAPTTKSSGTSIHGEHAPRGGNRQLKRAMFLSAFACMNTDPASRTYYDRQQARGKTHTQALLRLARQRISVLFAMLRDGTFYESRTPAISLAAQLSPKPTHHVLDEGHRDTPHRSMGRPLRHRSRRPVRHLELLRVSFDVREVDRGHGHPDQGLVHNGRVRAHVCDRFCHKAAYQPSGSGAAAPAAATAQFRGGVTPLLNRRRREGAVTGHDELERSGYTPGSGPVTL